MTGQTKSPKLSAAQLERLARFRAMAEQHLRRVGRAVQLRREDLGWSRAELARKVPVADKTIERWEKGQTGGASESLDRLAEVMRTTSAKMMAAALLEEEDAAAANGEPRRSPLDDLSGRDSEGDLEQRVDQLQSEVAELHGEVSGVRSDLSRVLSLLQRGERGPGEDVGK